MRTLAEDKSRFDYYVDNFKILPVGEARCDTCRETYCRSVRVLPKARIVCDSTVMSRKQTRGCGSALVVC